MQTTKEASNKPKLDALDFRILHELDKDAFQSLSHIGKKLKAGRDVMHYRVKRLEELEVIKKYVTIVDFAKLGYIMGGLYLKFRHESPELVKEIIEHYKERPEVWWVNEMEGQYDLAFAWFSKNIPELREMQRKLMEKYRMHIQGFEFIFYSKFYSYRRNYLYAAKTTNEPMIVEAKADKITDETDDQILKLLSENARMGCVEIADMLGLSAAQVHYRIKRLKEEKIILGARPQLDLNKLGYVWYRLEIYLDDYSVYEDLLKFASSHPNIVYAYDAFGGADLELDIEVKNYEEFKKLENDIKVIFSEEIEKTEFVMFTKEHKLIHFPQV